MKMDRFRHFIVVNCLSYGSSPYSLKHLLFELIWQLEDIYKQESKVGEVDKSLLEDLRTSIQTFRQLDEKTTEKEEDMSWDEFEMHMKKLINLGNVLVSAKSKNHHYQSKFIQID
jgi:hypothetical protein